MSNHAARCAEPFCGSCDETGSVHERGACHAELDLRSICDSVEEADEVCFVSSEAWVGGCGADLRDADRTAGESREKETAGQVTVAGELDESLVGVVGCHGGRVFADCVGRCEGSM